MRRSSPVLAALVAVVALSAPQHATADGTCERDGSTLVVRSSDASVELTVTVQRERVTAEQSGPTGPLVCDAAGLSSIRVLGTREGSSIAINFVGSDLPVLVQGADGPDRVKVNDGATTGPQPARGSGVVAIVGGGGRDAVLGDLRRLSADLGDGNDDVVATARESMTVTSGPGDDELDATSGPGDGPWTLDGADGDDVVTAERGPASWRILGGAGKDRISATRGTVSCGPDSDSAEGSGSATFDASCPPTLNVDFRDVATYARAPKSLRLPVFRLDRRATIVFAVSTFPPRGMRATAVTANPLIRTVGPGAVRLVVPIVARARAQLRSRSQVRGLLEIRSIRAPGSTEDVGGGGSGPVLLRRR